VTSLWTGWLTGTAGGSDKPILAEFDWHPTTIAINAQAALKVSEARPMGTPHRKSNLPATWSDPRMFHSAPAGRKRGWQAIILSDCQATTSRIASIGGSSPGSRIFTEASPVPTTSWPDQR
jgi:hypothetical protein